MMQTLKITNDWECSQFLHQLLLLLVRRRIIIVTFTAHTIAIEMNTRAWDVINGASQLALTLASNQN